MTLSPMVVLLLFCCWQGLLTMRHAVGARFLPRIFLTFLLLFPPHFCSLPLFSLSRHSVCFLWFISSLRCFYSALFSIFFLPRVFLRRAFPVCSSWVHLCGDHGWIMTLCGPVSVRQPINRLINQSTHATVSRVRSTTTTASTVTSTKRPRTVSPTLATRHEFPLHFDAPEDRVQDSAGYRV